MKRHAVPETAPHRLALAGALVLACALATPAQAEYYALMSGRSADLSRLPDTSVEAGAVFGDLYESDYQYFGARVNFRASPELMIYGDVGQVDIEFNVDVDGTAFGAGGIYAIEGFFEGADFALKAGYHRASVEGDNTNEVDLSGINVEALFSGREGLGASGNVNWYANIGMHRLDFDDVIDKETELGFGGGVVIPSASGELYVGLDIIDEMIFGAGFRYFLQ